MAAALNSNLQGYGLKAVSGLSVAPIKTVSVSITDMILGKLADGSTIKDQLLLILGSNSSMIRPPSAASNPRYVSIEIRVFLSISDFNLKRSQFILVIAKAAGVNATSVNVTSVRESPSIRRTSSSTDVSVLVDSLSTEESVGNPKMSGNGAQSTTPRVSPSSNTTTLVSSSDDNKSTVIGAAVGATLGAIALGVLGVVIYFKKFASKEGGSDGSTDAANAENVYKTETEGQANTTGQANTEPSRSTYTAESSKHQVVELQYRHPDAPGTTFV